MSDKIYDINLKKMIFNKVSLEEYKSLKEQGLLKEDEYYVLSDLYTLLENIASSFELTDEKINTLSTDVDTRLSDMNKTISENLSEAINNINQEISSLKSELLGKHVVVDKLPSTVDPTVFYYIPE